MTYSTIPINTPLTDSLSLRIPFDSCEILDKRLTSYTCVYYESLEQIDAELHPPKPIIITMNGITIRISLSDILIKDFKKNTEKLTKFINLTVSAKLLKSHYFDGINKDNIYSLYREFMRFEVFKCTFDTFLDGYCSDVDICVNRYVNHPNTFLDILRSVFSQSGTRQKYAHLINKPENLGLTFNNRNFAKPSLPFVKFYFKEWELYTKSAEFFNIYLADIYGNEIKNLTRIECTIKNYMHKKRLSKFNIMDDFKTLREFLELPQDQLLNFVKFSVESYIINKARIKSPDLSPTDFIIYELIQNSVIKGYSYEAIILLLNGFKGSTPEATKVAKSRMKKKVTELYDLLIHRDIKIESKSIHNNHIIEYLNFIGIKT